MESGTSTSRLFSAAQRDLVAVVLAQIIPADNDRPGAGDPVGLSIFEAAASPPHVRRAILEGFDAIGLLSWQQFDKAFVDIDAERQVGILKAVEARRPDFFGLLVNLAFRSYYGNPRTLARLGFDPRPPEPRGFTLPPFDAGQLDPVRARGTMHRDVPR